MSNLKQRQSAKIGPVIVPDELRYRVEAGDKLAERQLAIAALRAAADWWEARPDGFLQGRFERYSYSDGELVSMCSAANLSRHITGKRFDFTEGGLLFKSTLALAAGAVMGMDKKSKHIFDDLCGTNNQSTREQMIARFRAGADRLEKV